MRGRLRASAVIRRRHAARRPVLPRTAASGARFPAEPIVPVAPECVRARSPPHDLLIDARPPRVNSTPETSKSTIDEAAGANDRLSALIQGRALVAEGAGALLGVLGADDRPADRVGDLEGLGLRHAQRLAVGA